MLLRAAERLWGDLLLLPALLAVVELPATVWRMVSGGLEEVRIGFRGEELLSSARTTSSKETFWPRGVTCHGDEG